MVLMNEDNAVTVSLVKVYNQCIRNNVSVDNELYTWLPSVSSIRVNDKETIIKFKDETDEMNLGFTGIEWIISDYIDSFYIKE